MSTIKIKILCQGLKESQVELQVDSRSDVEGLKRLIRSRLESKPEIDDQRLIYAGKVLQNGEFIEEILLENDVEIVHAFHLVVRGANYNELRQRTQQQPQQQVQQPQSNEQSETNETSVEAWTRLLEQHRRQFEQQHQHFGPDGEQRQWFNQVYAQYVNQYMQYVQNAAAAGGAVAAAGAAFMPQQQFEPQQPQQAPAAVQENVVNAAIPEAAAAVNQAQQQQPGVNAVNAAGALGGAMEDEDEPGADRDILDHFYVMSRVLVLMSIVYFYSSFTRFFLVVGFGLIVALYNNGFFNQLRPQEQPQQQEQQQQPDQANEENAEERREGQEGEEAPQNPPPPPQFNALDTAFTFITTFFSSLLPEQPQMA